MWMLTQYEKAPGESLVLEWELRGADAGSLADIFGGEPWDELVYEVTERERSLVEDISGQRLDLNEFAYCVEAIASAGNEVVILDSGRRIFLPPRIPPGFPGAVPVRPRFSSMDG